ncbi:hypothetical protein C9I90_09015 [Photobacterium aphoticum]|uniref:Uncharacterized protein n=1 Tax=Photobacterium aphoticum TaxID=754436 RepID=A0A0J1GMU1_9GAMM|nr:hypothetical protein ABT58_09720 [Photobacterium aphoticum]PSU57615.1 hypothetical protein C9I90_09015 [Photobacterium aphoticum]
MRYGLAVEKNRIAVELDKADLDAVTGLCAILPPCFFLSYSRSYKKQTINTYTMMPRFSLGDHDKKRDQRREEQVTESGSHCRM